MIKILLFLVICILLGVAGYFIFFNKSKVEIPQIINNSPSATISGTIDLNGLPPQGSTITIGSRESNQGEFVPFAKDLSATDLTKWEWKEGKAGVNYDLQAEIMYQGQVVATSQTLTVTAPADSEQLTLNYSAKNNPKAAAIPSPSPSPVTISGTVDLNGYIPQGATIKIEGKKVEAENYTVIANNLPAKNGQLVSYTTAILDQEYNVRGTMYDVDGNVIGRSTLLTVTAPAANEILQINSLAQAPAPAPSPSSAQGAASPTPASGAISGSINFNGVTPGNSSIVILAAPNGTNNYQVVVNGVQPSNGSQWIWNNANEGTTYQLMAVLKQENSNNTQTDLATSQSIIVAAPAANEVLTINSNISLPAPQGNASIICQNKNNSNNTWSVQVNFPSQASAQGYWLQVGTTNGGNDIVNVTNNAQNQSLQTVNATFNDSVWYWARYAYTYTSNPNSGSGFSSFSGSFQLKCPS